ncbi:IS3 family transposase [Petrotoga sp. DB-2]
MMENRHVDFKSTPILDIQYVNRLHREYGVSLSYLFEEFNVNSSSYYYKTRLFLETSSLSKKKHSNSKTRGFCYTVNGNKVPDEFVIAELIKIKEHLNMYVSKHYLKTLGSTKLCAYFRKNFGIIINHKKMRRLKHEIGLVGKYTNHSPHPRRGPQKHVATAPNQFWEMDIKYFKTKDGYVQVFSIIDTFDRQIVGSYIGPSCKSKDIVKTIFEALRYRGISGKNLIIRSDNGTQFTSLLTENFMRNVGIIHEFGYPHNPDCQAFIESFHSSVQREFVPLNTFTNISDFTMKYKVYLDFYLNIRPHGSLNYLTPNEFHVLYKKNKIEIKEIKEKLIIFE